MLSYKDTVFRFMPEGTGGTFSIYDHEADTTDVPSQEYIGTFGCHTCVGVYFKIDNTRACCMHINGSSRIDFPKNLVSHQDGDIIKKELLSRLRREAEKEQWDPSNEDFGRDMVVVCPEPEFKSINGEITKRTGWYVIQGLREFFWDEANKVNEEAWAIRQETGPKLAKTESQSKKQKKGLSHLDEEAKALSDKAEYLHQAVLQLTPDREHQGFVVHHPTGATSLFKVDEEPVRLGELPEDIGDWAPRHEPNLGFQRVREWYITPYDNASSRDLARDIVQKNKDYMKSE